MVLARSMEQMTGKRMSEESREPFFAERNEINLVRLGYQERLVPLRRQSGRNVGFAPF